MKFFRILAGVVLESDHEPGGRLLKERKKRKSQQPTAGSMDTGKDSLRTWSLKSQHWILFRE